MTSRIYLFLSILLLGLQPGVHAFAQTKLADFGNYELTDLGSEDAVESLYQSLRSDLTYDPHRSNCYLRANVWAYQMWKADHVQSGKVFLIYTWSPTSPSIATYGLNGENWWFHVAPYVVANGKEYVLEKFDKVQKPMLLEDWERLHTMGATCKTLSMSEDRDVISLIQNKESITLRDVPCYVRKTPMNYNGPQDFYQHDVHGVDYPYPEPELMGSCRATIDRKGNAKKKCRQIYADPNIVFSDQQQQ